MFPNKNKHNTENTCALCSNKLTKEEFIDQAYSYQMLCEKCQINRSKRRSIETNISQAEDTENLYTWKGFSK